MAPAWTPLEDRALLLALIQSMAPEGPSKHQFEAAVKAAGGRWTFGAVSYVIPHHTTLSPILRRGSQSRSRLATATTTNEHPADEKAPIQPALQQETPLPLAPRRPRRQGRLPGHSGQGDPEAPPRHPGSRGVC